MFSDIFLTLETTRKPSRETRFYEFFLCFIILLKIISLRRIVRSENSTTVEKHTRDRIYNGLNI